MDRGRFGAGGAPTAQVPAPPTGTLPHRPDVVDDAAPNPPYRLVVGPDRAEDGGVLGPVGLALLALVAGGLAEVEVGPAALVGREDAAGQVEPRRERAAP